jgi:hypothetical protein
LKNALHSGSGGRLGADPRRDQASGRWYAESQMIFQQWLRCLYTPWVSLWQIWSFAGQKRYLFCWSRYSRITRYISNTSFTRDLAALAFIEMWPEEKNSHASHTCSQMPFYE